MLKNADKIVRETWEQQIERNRQRIKKEQQLYFDNYKKEFLNKSVIDGISAEDDKFMKKRLLDYVHKYVFLQRLEPLDNTSTQVLQLLKSDLNKKNYAKQFFDLRNVFSNFFRIKSVFILFSAFFFFFIEYYIHYYSSFSLNDINITFESIINKIPPFF
jgi:hypothetical protein